MYFLKELALTVEKFNYEYEMEYIFSYTAHLEAEPIGQGNRMSGFRSHFYMLTDLETN